MLMNEKHPIIELLPELKPNEVYFISLSARNKYLTEEERKYYALGRTEMFSRLLVRSKAGFEKAFRQLRANKEAYRTKSGCLLPNKCVVVYLNINPSDMVKAYNMFKSEMDREVAEIIQGLINGQSPNFKGIGLADRKLLNCVQKATGTRHFLDIDFDFKNPAVGYEAFVRPVSEVLSSVSISHHILQTSGGYHLLIVREELNDKAKKLPVPLHLLVKTANEELGTEGEVIFNSNVMIPLEQAGKLTKLIG